MAARPKTDKALYRSAVRVLRLLETRNVSCRLRGDAIRKPGLPCFTIVRKHAFLPYSLHTPSRSGTRRLKKGEFTCVIQTEFLQAGCNRLAWAVAPRSAQAQQGGETAQIKSGFNSTRYGSCAKGICRNLKAIRRWGMRREFAGTMARTPRKSSSCWMTTGGDVRHPHGRGHHPAAKPRPRNRVSTSSPATDI